jgi:hypothetical protein
MTPAQQEHRLVLRTPARPAGRCARRTGRSFGRLRVLTVVGVRGWVGRRAWGFAQREALAGAPRAGAADATLPAAVVCGRSADRGGPGRRRAGDSRPASEDRATDRLLPGAAGGHEPVQLVLPESVKV